MDEFEVKAKTTRMGKLKESFHEKLLSPLRERLLGDEDE